jgi:hypothetical protein
MTSESTAPAQELKLEIEKKPDAVVVPHFRFESDELSL